MRKGSHHTKEARQRISQNHADVSGEKNPMFGKTFSDKTKELMSLARKEYFKKNVHPFKGKRGALSSNWKGGRILNVVDSGKYKCVLIHCPDHPAADCKGYVFEHRLMVEKVLGRYLKSEEEVHHINGNTRDNRNSNFLVCLKGYHAALGNKIRKRRENDLTKNRI